MTIKSPDIELTTPAVQNVTIDDPEINIATAPIDDNGGTVPTAYAVPVPTDGPNKPPGTPSFDTSILPGPTPTTSHQTTTTTTYIPAPTQAQQQHDLALQRRRENRRCALICGSVAITFGFCCCFFVILPIIIAISIWGTSRSENYRHLRN